MARLSSAPLALCAAAMLDTGKHCSKRVQNEHLPGFVARGRVHNATPCTQHSERNSVHTAISEPARNLRHDTSIKCAVLKAIFLVGNSDLYLRYHLLKIQMNNSGTFCRQFRAILKVPSTDSSAQNSDV